MPPPVTTHADFVTALSAFNTFVNAKIANPATNPFTVIREFIQGYNDNAAYPATYISGARDINIDWTNMANYQNALE